MTRTAEHNSEPWPAERLREARAILADVAHHPDTRLVLAARVVIAHSRDAAERSDAHALVQRLDRPVSAMSCSQRGSA